MNSLGIRTPNVIAFLPARFWPGTAARGGSGW